MEGFTSTSSPYNNSWNVTQGAAADRIDPWWSKMMDGLQLTLALIGLLANNATFITLMRNGSKFSPAILLILRHQTAVDMVTCLFGAILLLQPHMWLPGTDFGDRLICYAWHGQAIYWNTVFVSIWNLVVLAFERFLAVRFPLKHHRLTTRILALVIITIYMVSPAATCGAYIQTRLHKGACLPEYYYQNGEFSYKAFAISTFFTFYAIPCILFTVLYGMVIAEFRQRPSHLGSSTIIDSATRSLTKTAVTVTIIFIFSIGYDLWYYMLGYAELVVYVVNSPIQRVGILLSTFNSVANPFVYALLMPAYRQSVKQTFCSQCPKTFPMSSQDTTESGGPTATFYLKDT